MVYRQLIVACAWVMSTAVLAQPNKPNPRQAFYLEAADCAAALEARVVERRAQPRTDARNQAILSDTELGFAFIAVAYKKGLRNPEADQMLKAAEKRWAALAKTEQQNRLNTCTTKGQHLMNNELSGLERFLVRNRAKARVDKWLQKEKT